MAEPNKQAADAPTFPPQSFPTLKPAFRFLSSYSDQFPAGDIHTGSSLVAVPCGFDDLATLVSVGDFEPKCKFSIKHAVDYFNIDADKSHGRIDARSTLVDDEGRVVYMIIEGITKLNDDTLPLILNSPDAKTSPFGHGIEYIRFKTGHDVYRPLENMVFVSSLRFFHVDGVKTGIEQRMSQVISGTGME